jgi:hypothetical protein
MVAVKVTAHLIFNFRTRYKWMISFTFPASLPHRIDSLVPIEEGVSKSQRRAERFKKEKNLLPLPGIEPWIAACSVRSLS